MKTKPTPAQALVIVPFPTTDEANVWADKVSTEYPLDPPLLVTAGGETVVVDPRSGHSSYELTFAGGWRAKVSDISNGVVIIAKPNVSDGELASLTVGGSR